MSAGAFPQLALTAGEPAGVGPELLIRLAQAWRESGFSSRGLIAITDRDLLARAAQRCNVQIHLVDADDTGGDALSLRVQHVALGTTERPGHPDPRNARHVLATLDAAADGCAEGRFDAIVTAPLQKSTINDAGIRFSGHTEYFAERAGAEVVMMLASPDLRVALATTHLPLAQVPAAITNELLRRRLRIVHNALQVTFGIAQPRIAVLGLNPHAGEGGHLGREEREIIEPLLDQLRNEGMHLIGPLPADTAFVPSQRSRYDAVLAMYHDQALPVLKSEAFERTVNITLGLPFIRTSVDHGTALDLAGTGRADTSSMIAAARMAMDLAQRRAAIAPSALQGNSWGEGPSSLEDS